MTRITLMKSIAIVLLVGLPAVTAQAQSGDATNLDDLLGAPPQATTSNTPSPVPNTPTESQGKGGSHDAASDHPASPAPPTEAPTENAVIPTPEAADEKASPSREPRRSASRMVEEIVVTAQKREESIQDVPQAVTAYSAGKLEAMGVQTVEDLQNITPGLTMTNEVGFNIVFLRGVGTDAFLPGADSSVPFYVDGIPLLATQGSNDTLGKITRVEVLKGPQGTLFGTNSVGGAIDIITPDPSGEFNGDLSVGYGNYNQQSTIGYVNIPVTSSFGVTGAAFGSQQKNFYTNDDKAGPPIIGVYAYGGRLKAKWDITDNLSNTIVGSWAQGSGNGGLNFENTHVAPVFKLLLPQDPKADRHYSMDSRAGCETNTDLGADTVDWKLPAIELKAIGSAQRLSAHCFADFDGSSFPLINATTPVQIGDQYTGELQFLSNAGTPFSDRFTWVGGIFYIYTRGGFDPVYFSVAPNALTVLGGSVLGQDLTALLNPITEKLVGINLNQGVTLTNGGVIAGSSMSAYFQGTLKLLDSLNLILGGRFQHTHRDLEDSETGVLDPNVPGGRIPVLRNTVPTLHANQFSPRVGFQWFFMDDANLYASWARGWKSPTYNTVNITGSLLGPIKPVLQEKVDSYEIGVKSELFDHSLQLNSALFWTREKDLLTGYISILTGGIVTFDNVPGARIRGAEGDAVWTPFQNFDPGLALTGSATYLDGKYTNYPNGRGYDVATGLPFGPGFPVPPLPARNFTGNRIVRTPDLTYNLGVAQTFEVGQGSLEMAVEGDYSSGFYFLPQDQSLYEQKAHYILNAHTTYSYKPWGLSATVWGKNLTNSVWDETEAVFEFGRMEMLNAPPTFGITLKWVF